MKILKSILGLFFLGFYLPGCGGDTGSSNGNSTAKQAIEEKKSGPDVAAQEWSKWSQKYASRSPLIALNKTSQWPNTDDQISKVLTGVESLTLTEELKLGGSAVKEVAIAQSKLAQGPDARDTSILNNMKSLPAARKADELLILYVGEAHAIDFYCQESFANPQDTLFASYPRNSTISLESQAIVDFFTALGTPQSRSTVAQDSAVVQTAFPVRLFYYAKQNPGKHSLADLKRDNFPKNPSTIVLMDWHAIDNTEVTDSLPSSASIKASGFTTIRVALGGFKKGVVSNDDLEAEYNFAKALERRRPRIGRRKPMHLRNFWLFPGLGRSQQGLQWGRDVHEGT